MQVTLKVIHPIWKNHLEHAARIQESIERTVRSVLVDDCVETGAVGSSCSICYTAESTAKQTEVLIGLCVEGLDATSDLWQKLADELSKLSTPALLYVPVELEAA